MNKNVLICVAVITSVIMGLILIGLLLLAINNNQIEIKGCSINLIKDFTYEHPLILHPFKNEFILPNSKNGLHLNHGDLLRLSCPGRYKNSNYLLINNLTETTITCLANKTFEIYNKNNNTFTKLFPELKCKYYPEYSAIISKNNCSKFYTEIQIGFKTEKGFLTLFKTCFNNATKDSLYSVHNLTNMKIQQKVSRPRYFKPDFLENLPLDPESIYTKRNQLFRFETLLNTSQLNMSYISQKSDFFLSRGHLAPKADFIYGAHQQATFFYVNVAPQWQTFNEKNWVYLENSCRNYVKKLETDLIIYTGVFGNAQLPDANGVFRNLSLYQTGNTSMFHVPEVFWKILYEPISKHAIAFIGHNNPYEKNIEHKILCTDICDYIKWVYWKPKNITLGYSYCCDVQQLKKVVHFIPNITVNGILI